MQIIITGRNVELSQALKDYVEKKVSRLEKYLEEPITVNVVLSSEKFRKMVDLTISSKEGVFHGSEESHDMYTSIDKVVDTMEITLRRKKEKIKESRIRGGKPVHQEAFSSDEASKDEKVVIEERIETKPMTVDEAVLQLEAGNRSFIVFINAETGRVNVLYKRKDGNFGLIVPD